MSYAVTHIPHPDIRPPEALPLAAQVLAEEPDANAPIRTVCMHCDRDKAQTRALWAQGFRVSHGLCQRHAHDIYGVDT